MRFVLLQKNEGFESVVFDEQKQIPDPAFLRRYGWRDLPRNPQEDDASYDARLVEYHDQIERESILLYNDEFKPAAPPAPVVEKPIVL